MQCCNWSFCFWGTLWYQYNLLCSVCLWNMVAVLNQCQTSVCILFIGYRHRFCNLLRIKQMHSLNTCMFYRGVADISASSVFEISLPSRINSHANYVKASIRFIHFLCLPLLNCFLHRMLTCDFYSPTWVLIIFKLHYKMFCFDLQPTQINGCW